MDLTERPPPPTDLLPINKGDFKHLGQDRCHTERHLNPNFTFNAICVGPDGLPSMPGDIWSCNCNNCSCNVDTLTVICKPVLCPPLVNETCTLKGYIVVPKVDPENPCCMKTECRCNTSSCIQIEESCPIGFKYDVTYTEGDCCLNYNCVPMDVCVVNNSTYQPGEVIPNTDNPCERCKCTDDKDNMSMLNKVKCSSRICDSCSPGYNNQIIKGTCCGTCNKVSCIKTLDNGTTIFLELRKQKEQRGVT
ncbi:intestinal mucin-like protein [Bombina bombina]|uniref:intestinal mucin-like protein n=1 Tax=Bombina bombina TaxID=8345 RepID=UPI00235ADA26|nr:intestinal mucin-like protein [Bombina bombina]